MSAERMPMECAGCAGEAAARPARGLETEIGRRTFLAQSAVLAAMAALAACAGDPTAPELSGPTTVTVSDYAALSSVGGVAILTLEGSPVAIVRTGADSFLALSRVCPHQGGTIQQSGSGFRCPEHGATFDKNGTWIGGQRTSSMHSYATSYDQATGVLTIG